MRAFAFILPYLVPIVWGLGGYFGGLFSKKTNSLFAGHLWITLGFLAWSAFILITTSFNDVFRWQWHWTGLALGLTYSLGGLLFILAISLSGSATKVVALSALYPAVTALILFGLHGESLPPRKIIGIFLAIVVGFLMA